MKKFITLLFAGLLFASAPGCAKKVDKADVPVPEVDIEGVPSFDDDSTDDDDRKTEAD